MAIKLITDSGADICAEEAEKMGIYLVPMTIHFGDEEYRSGIDLTTQDFYGKLAQAKQLPTTSQPTPAAFEEVYRKIIENGDQAIVLCISSALSGTYQSATIASGEYSDHIRVIDSKNVTLGQQLLACHALELIRQGCTLAEIAARLEEQRSSVQVFGIVETLEYLTKGGRLSKAAGLVGTMMGIRPVLQVNESGELAVVGKARGLKAAYTMLNDTVIKAGIDQAMPVIFGYTGTEKAAVQNYLDTKGNPWEGRCAPVHCIGSTIGTHVGPGAIVAAFFKKV